MGYSHTDGKQETFQWIEKNISKNANILDVGPGACTYGDKLKDMGFHFVDAVEIDLQYYRKYKQQEHYSHVYLGDVRVWQPIKYYDLVIFGDILEHLSVADAQAVLLKYNTSTCLVSIPWCYKQGALGGHDSEIHLQDDLTPALAIERYTPDMWLANTPVLGVFIRRPIVY